MSPEMVKFLQALGFMQDRKFLVRDLLCHPQYLHLPTEARLRLIRKLEKGLEVSAALLHLRAFQWIKTGRLEEDHDPSHSAS